MLKRLTPNERLHSPRDDAAPAQTALPAEPAKRLGVLRAQRHEVVVIGQHEARAQRGRELGRLLRPGVAPLAVNPPVGVGWRVHILQAWKRRTAFSSTSMPSPGPCGTGIKPSGFICTGLRIISR